MKRVNYLFRILLLALVFGSCTKNNDPNNTELIKGKWLNTKINGQTVLTDKSFVMEFNPDNTQLYAIGYQLDENNQSWRENNNYSYSIDGNLIYIDGVDVLGDRYHLVLKMLSLGQDLLTYSVQTFTINGEVIDDTKTYSCQRITGDYSQAFTGLWYGHCTSEGTTDSLYHYWEYFDDGSFNYYYQDENSNWIKKTDNEGQYFLYGNLMVSNYSHDLISGGTGLAFECWDFTIDENTMVWTGLRENNITLTYEMEKVQTLPQTVLGAAKDLLNLTPDLQPETFRNIDKIFPTRTIRKGNTVFPLPYHSSMLSSVTYSPDGVNSYTIDDFISRNNVAGLLIIKDGEIYLERYALGNDESSGWAGFSTTKSVVSTLIGIAVQDGKINSINDQVVDYLPQLAGTAYEGVSIKDLMQMSSGVAWNEDYLDSASDISVILKRIIDGESGGILNHMSGLTRVATPGTQYVYKTGETHVEAEILKSVLQGESISDYLSRKVWANMGMEADANWLLESENGTEFGGGLMSMTLRDYGRFGQFILNDGIINNEAILPAGWVDAAGVPPADAPQCACGELYSPSNAGEDAYAYPLGYSYNWWPMPANSWGDWGYLNDSSWWGPYVFEALHPDFTNLPGTFTAQGIFGQFIHINKVEKMVTIVLSAWEVPWIDPKEYETYCFINAAAEALKH